MNIREEFESEVKKFRLWAPAHKDSYGEWEEDYDNWPQLVSAAEVLINSGLYNNPDQALTDDILYAIARDNECGRISDILEDNLELLEHLATHAVNCNEWHAKWQLAVLVGESTLKNTAELIRPYLSDNEEYVRRRSLIAITPHSPDEAEIIAIKQISDEYEYTRIVSIHVLFEVNSTKLKYYLDILKNDNNEHVRSNVEEILSKVV